MLSRSCQGQERSEVKVTSAHRWMLWSDIPTPYVGIRFPVVTVQPEMKKIFLNKTGYFDNVEVVFFNKMAQAHICSFERQLFVPEKWCIRICLVIYFLLENNLSLSGWEWGKESIWVKSFDTPKFKQPRVKRLNTVTWGGWVGGILPF